MIVTNLLFLNDEVLFLLLFILLSVAFILCCLARKGFVPHDLSALIVGGLSLFGTVAFFLTLKETPHRDVCFSLSISTFC